MGDPEGRKHAGSDKAYDVWVKSVAQGVIRTQTYLESVQEDKPTLVEVRVKCDPDDEEGVLVILKGYIGTQFFVAFHRDDTYSAAMTSVGNRLRNGSLKWREDSGWKSEGK